MSIPPKQTGKLKDIDESEAAVESYLVREVEARGGIAEKVRLVSGRGFYDRLIVLPGGHVIFCETKKPSGGRISAQQGERRRMYLRLGAMAFICRSRADVDQLLALCDRLIRVG